jgi:small subunit ribosomal protein S20
VPRSRSKKKDVRQNLKRRARNKAARSSVRTAVKGFRAAASAGTDVAAELPTVQKKLDQAAAKGIIHKNAAARLKSRLAKLAGKTRKTPADDSGS